MIDLDELDRLYAEADTSDVWESTRKFLSAITRAYPALSARLRELRNERDELSDRLDFEKQAHDETRAYRIAAEEDRTSLRAELEAVKRERDELRELLYKEKRNR